jgi:hypothetical protein
MQVSNKVEENVDIVLVLGIDKWQEHPAQIHFWREER